MKNVSMFLMIIMLSMSSCNFSKGIKKDLLSGLTASYNGFALEEICLTDLNEARLQNNKVVLGTPLKLVATGVDNFIVKEGRVYPGCTIILSDKAGNEILNLPDAFSEMTTGTPVAQAKVLQASLNTGSPMVAGETYHLHVRFFDKNKKENEIVADVDLLAIN